MKKIFLTAASLLLAVTAAFSQQMPSIPVDSKVRIGQLENGITYYIRHNEEPKGQANFYIAQKVGSILEDDNQRGLAHFLEHMCFNGTEHFPGNGVIKYCEKIGVKFGADLNAYTSIDETVYNIDNVPVATFPEAVDSCLWILHDWADGLLLEDEDIDHERGVIHEEWRGSMNAARRMYDVILPEAYPGNKYGHRLPIGIMEVVDNFPYKALRDYYEKWYRPDLQGIVVVGDIDVDVIESKIKAVFSTIAAPVNPAERVYTPIEDNAETIVTMATDKEQTNALTYIFCKHDTFPTEAKTDLNYLIYDWLVSLSDQMTGQRIREITQQPNPPFVSASIGNGAYLVSSTKDAFTGVVNTTEAGLSEGIKAVYREMLRIARFGFTASEFERAKTNLMTGIENSYNRREKAASASFCKQYVRHFLDNEPIPGIENLYSLSQQILPGLNVEMVNSLVKSFVVEGNRVVACMLPEKEGVSYPSKEAVAAILKEVEAEEIAPYVDNVSDEPLIKELPAPGKVVSAKDSKFDYKKYVLSNGATVYFRSTDFNKNQVIMSSTSFGGTSLYPESEALVLKTASELYGIGGLGNFSRTELSKVLTGKTASVSSSINLYSEGVSGSCAPKDFETMLQLVYLRFTSPREDQDAFTSWKNRSKAALANAELNPNTELNDSVNTAVYKQQARISRIKAEQIDDVDYSRALEIASERFANAADFTFFFTGNIEEDTALPLIEQYIGALPSGGKKEKVKPVLDYRKGPRNVFIEKKLQQPMAIVFYFDSGKTKTDLKTRLTQSLASQCLSRVLLEEIREKEGGTYGISANMSSSIIPRKQVTLEVSYQTSPDKYEELNTKVEALVAKFAEEGPTQESLDKGKEYMVKKHQESQRENGYWSGLIQSWAIYGMDNARNYEKILDSITAEDVAKQVRMLKKQNNNAKLIMCGVE